ARRRPRRGPRGPAAPRRGETRPAASGGGRGRGGGARDPGGPAVGRGQPPRSGGAARGAVAGRDAAVPGAAVGPAGAGAAGRRGPGGRVEVQSVAGMLQCPVLLSAQQVGALPDDAFHVPALRGVWDVMLAAGTLLDAVEGTLSPARYLDQVLEIAGETVRPL